MQSPTHTPGLLAPKPGILNERVLIGLSFLAIYFIWGSTYLANAWAFQAFPPFFLSGIRFVSAGSIMFLIAGKPKGGITWTQARNAAIMGILMLSIGTGGAMWSIQFLDTGMVALLIGSQPLILVLLTWGLMGLRPGWMKSLGVLLGISGMAILVSQSNIVLRPGAGKGLIAILVSLLTWAICSLYYKRIDLPKSKPFSTAIQMLSGGILLFIVSALVGEDPGTILEKWNYRSLFATLYLIIFGSLLAYSAFNYLLLQVDPTKVATSNYVNPVIALLLGWSLLDEVLTAQSLIAATVLISGVVFINSDR